LGIHQTLIGRCELEPRTVIGVRTQRKCCIGVDTMI
jgi:hypothetical protein